MSGRTESPGWVQTSAVKVYMDETGHLPRLKKQLNAPRDSTMYGEGWMSEQDVREYMRMRRFGSEHELAAKGFDTSMTPEDQYKQIGHMSLTVEETEYYTQKKMSDPESKVSDPRTGDLTARLSVKSYLLGDKELPVTEDAGIGTVGANKPGLKLGLGGIGLLFIFAIGYLIFRGYKK